MPAASSSRTILLTGTVGSGKTAVMLAIGELLDAVERPYALVDLDWLAWLRPGAMTVDEVLAENLQAVAETFRRAGVERLVLACYVERRNQLEALRAALSGAELFVVRLAAPPLVIEARLRRRDTGAELEEHLAFAQREEPAGLEDAVVDSGDRPLEEVARDVLDAAGWPL